MDLESTLALAHDVPDALAFLEANDGTLQQDAAELGVYWAAMRPRSTPSERYYVCIRWTIYPHAPPSVKFATSVGGSLMDTSAWPVIPGYRAGNLDICKPFTAAGFMTHPEWRTGSEAWQSSGNPFLWVVQVIQDDLDTKYGGRAA